MFCWVDFINGKIRIYNRLGYDNVLINIIVTFYVGRFVLNRLPIAQKKKFTIYSPQLLIKYKYKYEWVKWERDRNMGSQICTGALIEICILPPFSSVFNQHPRAPLRSASKPWIKTEECEGIWREKWDLKQRKKWDLKRD